MDRSAEYRTIVPYLCGYGPSIFCDPFLDRDSLDLEAQGNGT
jgi:hypothetical protein